MIAFHGRTELKDGLLAELAKHRAADAIIQGAYARYSGDTFTGCAVGCSLQSYATLQGIELADDEHGNHALYETHFGIPRALARLEDGIFEGLPVALAKDWPQRFMAAIRPGADLSMVVPKFIHWLLTDPDGGVAKGIARRPQIKSAIDGVATLYQRWIDTGTKPSVTEWREARNAAYDAAYAAAAAADADAAYAAYAAYAAAARALARTRQADKLIELLEAA